MNISGEELSVVFNAVWYESVERKLSRQFSCLVLVSMDTVSLHRGISLKLVVTDEG